MSDTASPFDALKPLAGRALQEAINRALAMDPRSRERVAALHDRRVVLRLQEPALAMQLHALDGRVIVGKVDDTQEPDLGIRATISGVFAQLPGLRGNMKSKPGQVRIEGDAELARELQTIAGRFEPDLSKGFADTFGPVLGPQLAKFLIRGLKEAQLIAGKLTRDVVDYAIEERRDVVGKAELNAFHEDVDRLRDDVERAAAKLRRLLERST